MTECHKDRSMIRRFGLLQHRLKYFVPRHRWNAAVRSLGWFLIGHDSEDCQTCGRRYQDFIWYAPDPLWLDLMGGESGLQCPRCFEAKAQAAGIVLRWVPIVIEREGIATTNWWHDPTRDRLLMGEPDPHFFEGGRAQKPQGRWGQIGYALSHGEERAPDA